MIILNNIYARRIFIIIFFIIGNLSVYGGSGVITITDRSGNNQSTSSSVASDNIHIHASNYIHGQYQLFEGPSEPTSWDAIEGYEFLDDVYFFKKSENQFIRIELTDSSNGKTTKVIELIGGIVSAPVDDPILPADYVKGMGYAGLIVEADSDKDVDPVSAVIAMKKAGIYHIRMHIGRFKRDKATVNPINEEYFQNLDLWIEQISRHGMYCHIGNKTNSVAETIDGGDITSQDFVEPFAEEMEKWWDIIADRYKYASYHLAYQLFLESGKIKPLFNSETQFPGAPANLDDHYSRMTEKIRLHDSYRNIIYSPGNINDAIRIVDLGMPYADRNLDDGITTGSGEYYFSDFHRGFAGGGWHPGDEFYNSRISAAMDWVNNGGCPLILSACNTKDRVEYPTVDRVDEIETLFKALEGATHPIPITFLTLDYFYSYNEYKWVENLDTRARFEAINRTSSIDKNDPDGDFLSSDDEINIYGSNPNHFDTDRDNISDYAESLIEELNPNDSSDGFVTTDLSMNADLDGDGMSNSKEIEYATIDAASQSIFQNLNITDPSDSETALEGKISNIWESILHFNLDNKRTFLPRIAGGNTEDETTDHDGDGINTLEEVNANTWPLPYHDEGDVDDDGELIGTGVDVIPYTNNTSYILGYSFDDVPVSMEISNQAKQGGENIGVLIGDLLRAQNLIYLSANSYIAVDNTDFIRLNRRTVEFHFRAEDVNKKQIVYKEGDLYHGISLAIADGKLITTVWKTNTDMDVKSSGVDIDADKWYSVSLVFDGNNRIVKTTLHSNNRLLSRKKIDLSYSSITLSDNATVRIGGSEDGTVVLLPEGSSYSVFTNENFEGYMDELHIFNRVLSQTAISLLGRNDLFPAKDIKLIDSDDNGIPDAKDPNFEDNKLTNGEGELFLKTSLYPNPFKNEINLNFIENGKYKIQILDLVGQEIYRTTVNGNSKRIRLGNTISKGVYIININKNEEYISYKVVKK